MSDVNPGTLRFTPERLLAHAAWVRRLAGQLLADPAAADDLAQESLARALHGRPDDPERPRGWLTAIVRNTLRRTHREDEQREARERIVAPREALPSAAELAARASVHRAVVDAVLALPEPYRATVLLRFFEEIETSEIARRRGEPVETVRTRLKRGLAQLRERLGRELDVEARGGARSRGLEALLLLVEPMGGDAVVRTMGAVGMAMKAKLAVGVMLVAAGSWAGWQRWGRDETADRAVDMVVAAEPIAAPEVPVAERQLLPPDEREAADAAPSSGAEERVPLSPRMARLREELTSSNLFEGRNVVEDLGPEMRALSRGLTTDSLDLLALLDYLESRQASSWVVRGSLESTIKGFDGRAVSWTQGYENSSGEGSVFFASVEEVPDGRRGSVNLMAPLGQLRDEFTAQLGDASAISPQLVVNVHSGKDGVSWGKVQLQLREEQFAQMAVLKSASEEQRRSLEEIRLAAVHARDRVAELKSSSGLPSLVRWQLKEGNGELVYYRYGSRSKEELESGRRSARPLTDGEIAALRRLVERYQELAKEHVAGFGEKPASGK